MTPSAIPNLLTLLRILLIPPLLYALWQDAYLYALGLFLIAALSDMADGWLARRYHWQTELGAKLDPAADKLLVVSCYLTLAAKGLLPLWLMGLVVVRDVIIVGGYALYRRRIGPVTMEPTPLSKLNTLLQLALVVMVIVQGTGLVPVSEFYPLMLGIVALTTSFSGGHYIWIWSRRARSAKS